MHDIWICGCWVTMKAPLVATKVANNFIYNFKHETILLCFP